MQCIDQESGDGWTLINGDCVESLKGLPDHSIDYSIFSPPFASLYTYSNSPREPVVEIAPASQEPDAAGRALISKGIDPCSLVAEIVGIISGVEQAEREKARQERIDAERTPCYSKTKEAIAEAIESIMAYVKWNPECRTMSVAKAVGCCKSVAFDRLCRMEDDGMVTRYKVNNVSYWSVA